MAKINVLPKAVAELIAAGEVVERPMSVVKELIENSIDAGADNVAVEIKNGGIKYIRITDNGCGIAREDVRTAFISHATSKISNVGDLDAILTLGFRGEALPSVSAVSRLSLLTRTADEEIGTNYTAEGGEEIGLDDAGCPVGTTIIVRDLFFNTPARMKFLRRDATEGSYVADAVIKAALSHPEIKFSLVRDGKKVVSTPGGGDMYSAVYAIFGKDIAEALIKCDHEDAKIEIHGYISRPLSNRPNRNMQFFFVNGRCVRIPAAAPALDEAYKNSIMVGKFPMCFLSLTIPADKTDVNVHPAKTEIRFAEDAGLFESIYYAAKSALARGDNARPSVTLGKKPDVTARPIPTGTQMKLDDAKRAAWGDGAAPAEKRSVPLDVVEETSSSSSSRDVPARGSTEADIPTAAKQSSAQPAERLISGSGESLVLRDDSADAPVNVHGGPCEKSTGYSVPWSAPAKKANIDIAVDDTADAPSVQTPPAKPFEVPESVVPPQPIPSEKRPTVAENIRIIGEAFKTYIIVENGDKLLIIDKHAAHERMIFNEITSAKDTGGSQMLLMPVSVTLSAGEYAAVLDNIGIFEDGGFIIEDFGQGTVIVRACPVVLTNTDIADIVNEMAGKLLKGSLRPVPEKLDWLFHSAACRAAVKAGDDLKPEETESFVRRLLSDDSVRYCPHGRPVLYELSRREIEKQFGRLG